jgi:Holliday junction resolvase RusA-like endonuclease
MVTFKVEGNPVGKQRARYAKRGNFVQAYTPEKTRSYETLIKESAKQAMGSSEPLETPVSLYLYIRVPIPSHALKNAWRLSKMAQRSQLRSQMRPTF